MEAIGLAAGIVSLGLDLGTRLQTYVEGVKGAGGRLSALAADVSATASVVRQLADLLTLTETDGLGLFTAEGVADIEAVLRRCRHAYGVIVDVLLGAASGANSRTHAVLTAAGLGELTAARLARLSSRARWPWLEPRVRACETQLRTIKMDLLLSLQVASLLKHRMDSKGAGTPGTGAKVDGNKVKENEKEDEDDEDAALLAVATKLMQKRRRGSEASYSSSEESSVSADELEAHSKASKASKALEASSGAPSRYPRTEQPPAQNVPNTTEDAATPTATRAEIRTEIRAETWEETRAARPQQHMKPPSGFVELAEGMSIGSLRDAGTDTEAWLIVTDAATALFSIPVRGPLVEELIRTREVIAEVRGENPSMLHKFLSLRPPVRWAVWDVMDRVQKRDARVRTLVGVFTPETDAGVPETCEALVLVSAGEKEEVVHLEDRDGRVWRVPFYALKTLLTGPVDDAGVTWALLRYCGGRPSEHPRGYYGDRFRLRVSTGDAQAREFVSLRGLHDHLRPGMRIQMDAWEDAIWSRSGFLIVDIDDRKPHRKMDHDDGFEWVRKKERLSRERDSSEDDSEYKELFGDEAAEPGTTTMEGLDNVEDLLVRWTRKEDTV